MPLVRKTAPPPPPPGSSLTSADAGERWNAARTMTRAEDVAALGKALAQETDVAVREAILTSLSQIATPESAGVILPGVRADDANVRRGALDALIAMPQAALPYLPGLLMDSDADVRILSCEIVRALPSIEATRLLTPVIQSDPVVNVCISAVDVLAEIGAEQVLPALAALERRFPGEDFLHFAIAAARERISGASGRE